MLSYTLLKQHVQYYQEVSSGPRHTQPFTRIVIYSASEIAVIITLIWKKKSKILNIKNQRHFTEQVP